MIKRNWHSQETTVKRTADVKEIRDNRKEKGPKGENIEEAPEGGGTGYGLARGLPEEGIHLMEKAGEKPQV